MKALRKESLVPFAERAVRSRATLRSVSTVERLKPSFMIIGAQRCGTTSLYHYLSQHPAVQPAIAKEVHFFDNSYTRGLRWYLAHFPAASQRQRALREGRDLVTGEASPYYVFHPAVAERVKKALPDVKLILMLRDPVKRAYSHYQHEVALGEERLSFEEALDAERGRLSGERERLLEDPSYRSFNYQHHSYVARGAYVEQLRTWLRLFATEQLLVLTSEAFYKRSDGEFKRVLEFLGLPPFDLPAYEPRNTYEYDPMTVETRERLAEVFRTSNQELYELLGTDLGWSR
jgi:Sulfotransferase domain